MTRCDNRGAWMKRTYKIARQREPRELIAQFFDVAEIGCRPETLKDIQMSAPAVLRSTALDEVLRKFGARGSRERRRSPWNPATPVTRKNRP